MRYGHLTWPEIKVIDKNRVVLLPLGSCEQHGPHMPLLTDTLLVTAFAEAVEGAMNEDILLLPTYWMGMSDHHLPFPGTVTANPELYTRWIVRSLESLIHHGFRKIFLLNGHGGNDVPSRQALVELYSRGHERPDLWVGTAGYWQLGQETVRKAVSEGLEGIKFESPQMVHAGEWEYSLGLHLFPELCRREQAKAIPATFKSEYYDVDLAKSVIGLSTPFTAFLPTGAANRPELASREKGRVLFDGFCRDVIKFFQEYKSWKKHTSIEDMGVF